MGTLDWTECMERERRKRGGFIPSFMDSNIIAPLDCLEQNRLKENCSCQQCTSCITRSDHQGIATCVSGVSPHLNDVTRQGTGTRRSIELHTSYASIHGTTPTLLVTTPRRIDQEHEPNMLRHVREAKAEKTPQGTSCAFMHGGRGTKGFPRTYTCCMRIASIDVVMAPAAGVRENVPTLSVPRGERVDGTIETGQWRSTRNGRMVPICWAHVRCGVQYPSGYMNTAMHVGIKMKMHTAKGTQSRRRINCAT